MIDLEVELDKFLRIKTNGRDGTQSNFINFPYEATPYCVLQNLANSGYINKRDLIVDFGCGKGRVDFFLAYSVKAKMIGVELDERLFTSALRNLDSALSSNRVNFVNCNASDYKIPTDVTGLYFFNPFSVEVLSMVIENARLSKQTHDREIKLFFYYISKEYLDYLNEQTDVIHVDDIDCTDQFKEYDDREYIVIYKI